MSILHIAFTPDEVSLAAGLAEVWGTDVDVICLSGKTEHGFFTGWANVPPADNFSASLAEFAQGYDYIGAASSMAAKDLLARIAGLLDAPMATDIIGFTAPNYYQRPVAAGAAIETVALTGTPQIFTFRPSAFPGMASASKEPKQLELAIVSGSTRTKAAERSGARPDLTQAKVVVSGGRPLQNAENFERIIGGLADRLHGAVGATRAAVDSGIAANDLQVGQTGKIVAPDLYIAAGISGSTQHMAGIKDSKVIVAINKDAAAPIFDIADFGLVADLFDAVPELMEKLPSA